MSKYTEKARKKLPHTMRLRNEVVYRKRTGEDFRRMENMLWNMFGPPLFQAVYRDDPDPAKSKYVYKRNKDAVWQRLRNEFFFKEESQKTLALTLLPDEFEISKKII